MASTKLKKNTIIVDAKRLSSLVHRSLDSFVIDCFLSTRMDIGFRFNLFIFYLTAVFDNIQSYLMQNVHNSVIKNVSVKRFTQNVSSFFFIGMSTL